MSILIKGMEMPKGCMGCLFCKNGSPSEWDLYCGIDNKHVGNWDDKHLNNGWRRPDCPLVKVPTPHGPLIDAEEKIDVQMFDEMHEEWTLKTMSVAEYLAFAADTPPTIIEAEGGE